jgi:class 3 adenylate cyclase/tetratricopeptide (TPR) repeat protein
VTGPRFVKFEDMTPAAAAPTEAAGGERRHLTLLFSDLSDSTRLGEAMEAEDYAEMLAAWRALCRRIVPRHGGHIARIQGDGVLAFFGWPEAGEDDGRRATEAALELHAAVRQVAAGADWAARGPSEPLTLHSGIHAGQVFVADGDLERGRFELLGNVPNIAARLSSLAGRDDIVVSQETLGPQVHFFVVDGARTLQVKGRSSPLAVVNVLGRAATAHRFEAQRRRGLSDFVGREAELRTLREQQRLAAAGSAQCAIVSAMPGMGKTRLVEELLRTDAVAGCSVLRGYCESYLGAEPLQPFMQMLRGALPLLGAERLAAEAGALLQGDPAARADAPALLARVFAGLAERAPLVLVLDDWQWSDEASQQAIEATLALRGPIFLLVATRTPLAELLFPAPATKIALEPLSAAAAERVIARLLPGADPFVAADIHRYAGGTPLYIEELCHAAAAPGSAWQSAALPGSTAWLDGLIESRVSRLPAALAPLVRAAAVVGTVAPMWLLARITGAAADDPAWAALAEHDLLFPGDEPGTLRFKHGITRDVVYAAVGLHVRRQLHRDIAAALLADTAADADRWVEALAYHHAAGEQHAPAAACAERAGDRALAASALDRARAQYSAALTALDQQLASPGDGGGTAANEIAWCQVVQKLGMACVFDPLALADGFALFERGLVLARRSGRIELIARATYWLAYLHYAKGQMRAALPHAEAALELAVQAGDPRLAAQVRAMQGQTLQLASRYDDALPLLDAALAGKKRQVRGGGALAVGSVYSLACKATALGDQGRFALAEEAFDEAMALIGDVRHQIVSSVRHWRSVVLQWQGRWMEAWRMADHSAEVAEFTRSRHQLAMGRALAAHARWMHTREPAALDALREATAWVVARRGSLALSLNFGYLVEGALATGHADEARGHAARLFMRARQLDRLGEAQGCRALARHHARLADFGRAERYLLRAMASAAARGSAHEEAGNRLCQAQLLLERGQVAAARDAAEQALASFEQLVMRWHAERARRLLEQL